MTYNKPSSSTPSRSPATADASAKTASPRVDVAGVRRAQVAKLSVAARLGFEAARFAVRAN